jgi:hypothetical protein
MASTRKKTVVKAITERAIDEKKLESFDARLPNIDQPRYEAVCGSTGSGNIFKQFSEQIGCFSKDEHPSDWIDNRERFRKQFDKARQCFYGRVKRMNSFTANTNVTRKSRKGHAFAAKAAYGLGRNCLRKFADMPGSVAQDKFKNTADTLIDSLTQNSVKKELRANGSTINDGLRADDSLKELYERTYDLEPENWAKFRHYAVLTAPDFEAKNYEGGTAALRDAEKAYMDTFFETKPNTPESGGAVGGAGKPSYNTTGTNKSKGADGGAGKPSYNTTRANKSKKGRKTMKKNNASRTAANNIELEKCEEENCRFPELETVTYEELEDAAKGSTYDMKDMPAWIESPRMKTLVSLLRSSQRTHIDSIKLEKQIMLELIAPLLYYKTSFAISSLKKFILSGEVSQFPKPIRKWIDYIDFYTRFTKMDRLRNDYVSLNFYLYSNIIRFARINPFSLTENLVWGYIAIPALTSDVSHKMTGPELRRFTVALDDLKEGEVDFYKPMVKTKKAQNAGKGARGGGKATPTNTTKKKSTKPSAAASN